MTGPSDGAGAPGPAEMGAMSAAATASAVSAGANAVGSFDSDPGPGPQGGADFTTLGPIAKPKPAVSAAPVLDPKVDPTPTPTPNITRIKPPPITTRGKATSSGIRTPAPATSTISPKAVNPDTNAKGRASDVFAGTLSDDDLFVKKKVLGN